MRKTRRKRRRTRRRTHRRTRRRTRRRRKRRSTRRRKGGNSPLHIRRRLRTAALGVATRAERWHKNRKGEKKRKAQEAAEKAHRRNIFGNLSKAPDAPFPPRLPF